MEQQKTTAVVTGGETNLHGWSLRTRTGDVFEQVGIIKKKLNETDGTSFYTVEGADFIIGANDEGKLLLKQKNPEGSEFKYTTVTGLFWTTTKKDGTAVKTPYYGGSNRDKSKYYMVLPPKATGSSGKGPTARVGGGQRRA